MNIRNGYGIETTPGDTVYKGEWKNGVKHGYADIIWDNATYAGCLVEGLMSGQGTYTWADGRVYDGEWFENSMHGKG